MRRYKSCEKVLETYPETRLCGRPSRPGTRCPLHPVKRLWPGNEIEKGGQVKEEENIWKDADVISSYSRAQALEDGFLVDLDVTAKEAGFKWPVAMTRTAFEIVNPSQALKAEGQSWAGRAWDMLMILRREMRGVGDTTEIAFAPLFVLEPGQAPQPVKLNAVSGPGDNAEPVITIMLPEED